MTIEHHLFTLRPTYDPRIEHRVLYWGYSTGVLGYGVVCPSRCTTNGSYRFLVGCLKGGSYTIEPGLIAPKSMDEWDLLDAIREWLIEHTQRPDLFPRVGSTSWS